MEEVTDDLSNIVAAFEATFLGKIVAAILVIFALWLFNWLLGEPIDAVVKAGMREFRLLIQGQKNLKSLNALFMIVTLVGLFGFARLSEAPRYGEGLWYGVLLVFAGLACVYLSNRERR